MDMAIDIYEVEEGERYIYAIRVKRGTRQVGGILDTYINSHSN